MVATVIDYKTTFGTDSGKRVLYNLIKTCGYQLSSFSDDPYTTAFKEGQRNAVLHILNKLKTDPLELAKFIKEREKEQ